MEEDGAGGSLSFILPLVLAGLPLVMGFAGGRPRVPEVVACGPTLVAKSAVETYLSVDVQDA